MERVLEWSLERGVVGWLARSPRLGQPVHPDSDEARRRATPSRTHREPGSSGGPATTEVSSPLVNAKGQRAPLVSVVLIFLDAEEFLADAIESVFQQTYEQWELLLVDDGSTDGSTEIAREVAREHPERVTYLDHPGHANRGPSASRNAGIRAARGAFVAFLDGDDVWQPHKVTEQVAILEKHPAAGLVYGVTVYWRSWQESGMPDFRLALGVDEDRLYRPPVLLTGALRSRVPTPCPSAVLVRRALAVEVGGFDDGLHPFEDQAFLAKVYVRAPVYVAGESWTLYRQHAASAVARMAAAGGKYDAGLVYFEWLERYLVEQGITDRQLWRALRQKKRRYAHPGYDRLFRARLQTAARLRRAAGRVKP